MIIGVDYYGYGFDQQYYDTPIPTSELDEVTLGAGLYDELFISVDTTIDDSQTKPSQWTLKTIMDAEFNNGLEAGSINGKNHLVTQIQCYRREYMQQNSEWQLVAQFDYDDRYNIYTVIDRFIENNKTYEYCVVPLAKEIQGDKLLGAPIQAEFNGMFISDLESNYSININFSFSDLTYNTNMNTSVPLNGEFPIVSYGNANYRTGSASFLPLTPQQEFGYTSQINAYDEFKNRKNVIDFLNNGKAKVIRREDGDVMVVATNNVKTTAISESLDSISTVTFDFTEIGKLDYNTMEKAGLIADAGKSLYTYDEYGNIRFTQEPDDSGAETDLERERQTYAQTSA